METDMLVRHTANAGLLINIGKKRLGVDLFSCDPEGLYLDTPAALKKELLKQVESGSVGALLFTHSHADHFCLRDVVEALKRNPDLMVVSTNEVIGLLQAAAPFGKRLYAISPEERGNVRISFPNETLELFNNRHMGEGYAAVQNLVCLLETQQKRIVIPGDAWPEPRLFERIAAWSPEIDLLAGPFPMIGLPSNRRMITEYLRVRQILAMHFPKKSRDTQDWIGNTKRVCEAAKDGLPMPVFGEILGQEYIF